ncbi:MAG: four helix bundle protein [Candidatus Omnitrophica bacterium]|nr:four helix bundle protein [Candidatus Omnitrophota bacterium]
MTETQNSKQYDLGERTKKFAKRTRDFVKDLARTIANTEDARQLVRSSGSVGANYVEAEEALSKKDFVMRIKISRKEAKESKYWLELIDTKKEMIQEKEALIQEAGELTKIFGAIVQKSK